MSNNLVLINFNVPSGLKAEFDQACKGRNLSRTSVLIGLVERFLDEDAAKRTRSEAMEEDHLPVRIFSTEWDHF